MAKQRLEEIRKVRLEKVKKLRKLGINPYPSKVKGARQEVKEARKKSGKKVNVVGRLWGWREHGNTIFADLRDGTGQVQLWFQKENLKDKFSILKLFDIGDFIYVAGKVTKTKAGEVTVDVSDFQLLTKSIRPLPSTWEGLRDVELRFRKRYLDLLMNPEIRDVFILKGKILSFLRDFMKDKGFLEVEIPVLQPVAGGAAAKPFVTHLEALHQDYFLRIAPELYLKRLLVGGYEKVYELGKNFRNEGFSQKHNPEYTMLEYYQAYVDYNDVMDTLEEMLTNMVKTISGNNRIQFRGKTIVFKSPWPRLKMRDLILKNTKINIDIITEDQLKDYLRKEKVDFEKSDGRGKLIDKLFSAKVEPKLMNPTFVIDLPIEVSPLAKRVEGKEGYVQRFEAYLGGVEIANAYSELNDPLDQKKRFLDQAEKAKKGDEETHPVDEDYIEALEYGMPPAGGIGIGIDRLVMLFADLPSVRESILFPTLRPEK